MNCHHLLYKGVRFTYVKKYNREHKKNSHNINLIDQISGMGHILIEILNKVAEIGHILIEFIIILNRPILY